MPYTQNEQRELTVDGINNWFSKYSEFLSCFELDGEDGLKARLSAVYNVSDLGETELNNLAANSMGEAEFMRALRRNPDADYPNYDRVYLAAVSRIASEALLQLMERGVLDEIKLIDEFPPAAQKQYDAIVAEARPRKAAAVASQQPVDLKKFADDYHKEKMENLRPKNGTVFIGGERISLGVFESLFAKAAAAGLIRG
jgi:hypothetical protein